MKCRRVVLSLLILLLPTLLLRAEEGMFQPYKLPPEVFAKMKALGFTLSEKDLFSPSGSLSRTSSASEGEQAPSSHPKA